jgi:RNA polymerase sigma-70 factor (ECF subfamily)
MNPHDEEQWIERAKCHPEDFRTLYQAYFQRLYTYVAYRVSSQADAEDVTSDVFAQVVKSIHRFEYRGEGTFAAWLFRIAHNTIGKYYRRSLLRQSVSFEEIPDILSNELLPEQMVSERERFRRVHTAIQHLSKRRQEVITLRYFAGLRNQDIAEVLGLDERTVSAHLSRALADLQRVLFDELEQQSQ